MNYKLKLFVLFLFASTLFLVPGCGIFISSIDISKFEDNWMDSPLTQDESLIDSTYLVSTRITTPDEKQLSTPVIITAHGYSATTFEWQEFKEYAEKDDTVLVSSVLLGGHGRSLISFKNSTWQDWQQPVIDEYNALLKLGYKNINIASSSTGGALVLDIIKSNKFISTKPLNQLIFIDALVVARNKFLSLIDLIGIFIPSMYVDDKSEIRRENWYNNDLKEALSQLNKLSVKTQTSLYQGIVLPSGTKAKVFQAKNDSVVDPFSATLIYNGLKDSSGNKVEVEMLDSDKHVCTQLRARESYDRKDELLQKRIFDEILTKVKVL